MEYEILSQKEFIGLCIKGQKLFSNIKINFMDVSNIALRNITIKNSILRFCTFRDCRMENIIVENCEIYFGSFYTTNIKEALFDNCNIELTLFDTIQFDKTKMNRCTINFVAILKSNTSSLDFSTSQQFRLITDVSQITPELLEQAVSASFIAMSRLDINLKMKIKQMINEDLERHGFDKDSIKIKEVYKEIDKDPRLTYGEVNNLVKSFFGQYSNKNIYETKKTYETKKSYK